MTGKSICDIVLTEKTTTDDIVNQVIALPPQFANLKNAPRLDRVRLQIERGLKYCTERANEDIRYALAASRLQVLLSEKKGHSLYGCGRSVQPGSSPEQPGRRAYKARNGFGVVVENGTIQPDYQI